MSRRSGTSRTLRSTVATRGIGRSVRTRGERVTFGISAALIVVLTAYPFADAVCARTTFSRVVGFINSFIKRRPVMASFA